jgi:transcriptional regulator
MYIPKHFEETDLEVLHGLIRAHPLGALVALGNDGLEANHIPFLVDSRAAACGVLHGHMARANPMWKSLAAGSRVLVIFQGAEGYITPSWYATKRENGKVVPTWNFVVVHAHGSVRVIDDAAWLHGHLEQLTREHEARREQPWQVSDAPREFIEQNVAHLVGLEIPIARLEGKWKLSQNRSARDREGVVEGLRREGGDAALAMAELVSHAKQD